MPNKPWSNVSAWIFLALISASVVDGSFGAQPVSVSPAAMPPIGTVSDRYQSYNIEMLEVTGGRFWAPYKHSDAPQLPAENASPTPAGMDPALYRYRAPIDLSNPRLLKLAAALGPAYLRVSGTWANTTFFQDSDDATPATPPAGFGGVLTRKQWRGVIDFSRAVDAKIVTSFSIGAGVRNAAGLWTPVEAKKLLSYTTNIHGSIAAAELFNEPNIASMGGAPKGYDAAAYGRDFIAFRSFIKEAAPRLLILGPGSVGEGTMLGSMPGLNFIKSEDMLGFSGARLDGFSYHFYGAVSKRCGQMGASQTSMEAALSDDWLSRTMHDETYYSGLRDRFAPGKPLWVTETGESACGGNPWASTFVDSFRYLNQLGMLAKAGVQVVIHNTLAASDYALIDETTLVPRPNYWSALLWRRFMGTTVLDSKIASSPPLYVYAHCLRDHPGGVAALVLNADRTNSQEIHIAVGSNRYSLTAKNLTDTVVQLNGQDLEMQADGTLPTISGVSEPPGKIVLLPTSITFLTMSTANNPGCR